LKVAIYSGKKIVCALKPAAGEGQGCFDASMLLASAHQHAVHSALKVAMYSGKKIVCAMKPARYKEKGARYMHVVASMGVEYAELLLA
jgi:hypothetical protein